MEKHANTIEYEVYGNYALFSDPVVRVGGEKTSYSIPTYEALRGITESIFWKPTIFWVIDEIRVMNRIQTETKGIRPIKYNGGNELAYYTYLKDVRYQVRAHFEFNEHQVNMVQDRNERKYQCMSERMVKSGGRRDIFLGTRECQAFVEPCEFGSGAGYYDDMEKDIDFGFSYHGITYAEEAVLIGGSGKNDGKILGASDHDKGRLHRLSPSGRVYNQTSYTKMQPKIFENIEKEEHEKREVKDT